MYKKHIAIRLDSIPPSLDMTPTRKIGNSTFPAIGFGAMGISGFYGEIESDEDRFKVGVRLQAVQNI
jgi:hypothetical protein